MPYLKSSLLIILIILSCTRVNAQGNFSRDSIIQTLKTKIKNNQHLVVHIFVPLCDNVNQGIVPVNASLGNGMNLQTNLYWGAGYGMKTHFKRSADWKLIESKLNPDANILERVIFNKKFSNGANVYIVADAYRGDRMKECMENYLKSMAGEKTEKVGVNNLSISGGADFLIFNGHDGLMDMNLNYKPDQKSGKKDAVVIACMYYRFFKDHLSSSGGYPLVMTTNLMAPEAYVAEAIINSWAMMNDGPAVKEAAALAYNKFQKCGMKGARGLFRTGW